MQIQCPGDRERGRGSQSQIPRHKHDEIRFQASFPHASCCASVAVTLITSMPRHGTITLSSPAPMEPWPGLHYASMRQAGRSQRRSGVQNQ